MSKKNLMSSFAPTAQAKAIEPAVKAAPDNRAKFQKVFVLTAEQNDQLKSYCFHAKTTIQDVTIEGINMVLRSKGLPELKS